MIMASQGWLVEPATFGLADAVMISATDALVGREVINIYDYPHLRAFACAIKRANRLLKHWASIIPTKRAAFLLIDDLILAFSRNAGLSFSLK